MYDRLGGMIDRATTRSATFARSTAQGMVNLIGTTTKYAAVIGGFVGGAGALLIRHGIRLNAEMERYNVTLTTVLGSQARANAAISWIIRFAERTPFEVQGLVDASARLESVGLSARRWLPLVGDMAAAFGGTTEQVNMLIRALSYLQGGRTGEAMEVLARFAISRRDLERQGASFNSQGQLTSGIDQGLAALERIIQKRFGGLMEKQSKTLSGTLSNLKDMFTNTLRDTTGPLFDYVTGKAQRFLETLNRLRDSGQIARLTNVLGGDVKGMAERFSGSAGRVGDAFVAGGFKAGFRQVWEEIRQPAADFVGWFARTLADGVIAAFRTLWSTPEGKMLIGGAAAMKFGPALLGAGVSVGGMALGAGMRGLGAIRGMGMASMATSAAAGTVPGILPMITGQGLGIGGVAGGLGLLGLAGLVGWQGYRAYRTNREAADYAGKLGDMDDFNSRMATRQFGIGHARAQERYGVAGGDVFTGLVQRLQISKPELSQIEVIVEAFRQIDKEVEKIAHAGLSAEIAKAASEAAGLKREFGLFRPGRIADLDLELSRQRDATTSIIEKHLLTKDDLLGRRQNELAELDKTRATQASAALSSNVTGPFTMDQIRGALDAANAASKQLLETDKRRAELKREILELEARATVELIQQNRQAITGFIGQKDLTDQIQYVKTLAQAAEIRQTKTLPSGLSDADLQRLQGTGLVDPTLIAEEAKRRAVALAGQRLGAKEAGLIAGLDISPPTAMFQQQADAIVQAFQANQQAFIDALDQKIQPLTDSINEALLTGIEQARAKLADELKINLVIDPSTLNIDLALKEADSQDLTKLTDLVRQMIRIAATSRSGASVANRTNQTVP